MAKADLRIPEIASNAVEIGEEWRERIGGAIDSLRMMRKLSCKEFADAIGRDEAQIRRWINGKERAQFDAIFAVEAFRRDFIIALAHLSEDVVVETTISIRRAG
jgi:transcriptional regulator with XRE-family HTH domain